jgi:hypothetical protein
VADRPTTSRWAPPVNRRQTLLIKSGRSSKARTKADTSSARQPRRSQSLSESDLGSAFDPTRTVARAGTQDSTPGSLSLSRASASRHRTGDPRATPGALTGAIALPRKRPSLPARLRRALRRRSARRHRRRSRDPAFSFAIRGALVRARPSNGKRSTAWLRRRVARRGNRRGRRRMQGGLNGVQNRGGAYAEPSWRRRCCSSARATAASGRNDRDVAIAIARCPPAREEKESSRWLTPRDRTSRRMRSSRCRAQNRCLSHAGDPINRLRKPWLLASQLAPVVLAALHAGMQAPEGAADDFKTASAGSPPARPTKVVSTPRKPSAVRRATGRYRASIKDIQL